jgi:hypothetical protein
MHRPSRRTSAVIAAAVCLLGGGVVTGAQALQPVRHAAATEEATEEATVEAAPSLRLPKPPIGKGWTALGLSVDRSVQSVNRAKLRFNVKPFRAFTWLQAIPTGTGFEDATAEIYITDPGSVDTFGEFAPVTVKMLAFGTIPVSATVHISQLRHGKTVVPLEVKLHFSTTTVKPPTPGLPCWPTASSTNLCSYTDSPHLSGQVDVRVDNVRIDQVPVDVGPNCHTASPATMSLTAAAGFYSLITKPPYVPKDMYLPFFVGGTLHGPVDVPAFTGCHNGGDDLSPVVTAMVAGPGNELATHQDGPLVEYPPPPHKNK